MNIEDIIEKLESMEKTTSTTADNVLLLQEIIDSYNQIKEELSSLCSQFNNEGNLEYEQLRHMDPYKKERLGYAQFHIATYFETLTRILSTLNAADLSPEMYNQILTLFKELFNISSDIWKIPAVGVLAKCVGDAIDNVSSVSWNSYCYIGDLPKNFLHDLLKYFHDIETDPQSDQYQYVLTIFLYNNCKQETTLSSIILLKQVLEYFHKFNITLHSVTYSILYNDIRKTIKYNTLIHFHETNIHPGSPEYKKILEEWLSSSNFFGNSLEKVQSSKKLLDIILSYFNAHNISQQSEQYKAVLERAQQNTLRLFHLRNTDPTSEMYRNTLDAWLNNNQLNKERSYSIALLNEILNYFDENNMTSSEQYQKVFNMLKEIQLKTIQNFNSFLIYYTPPLPEVLYGAIVGFVKPTFEASIQKYLQNKIERPSPKKI